jgi:hypothetical protein
MVYTIYKDKDKFFIFDFDIIKNEIKNKVKVKV